MARFTVGGEIYQIPCEQVEREMRKVEPEFIQKHYVEILSTHFPPKQVFSKVTGRKRASFTTQEAKRILERLRIENYSIGNCRIGKASIFS